MSDNIDRLLATGKQKQGIGFGLISIPNFFYPNSILFLWYRNLA